MKRVLAIACVLAACSSKSSGDSPLVVDDGCQALLAGTTHDDASPGFCDAPYPSDFFRTADGHVAFRGAAQLEQASGKRTDVHVGFPSDGFSTLSTIVASLPGDVVHDGLATALDEATVSTSPASASVILEADTGVRVPHYADVYTNVADGQRRPIVLRPMLPLKPKTRYVVAFAGVKVDGGALAPSAEGFRRLRDKAADPALGAYARFENDVFAPLEKAGVTRASLQLAWDFTTGTTERATSDMTHVREMTLAWLASNTPMVTIASAADASDRLAKIVKGSVTGPMFLDSPSPGSHLVRGGDGAVAQNGTTTFDFEATIPSSLLAKPAPGRVLAYGHGFFGDVDELEGGGARTIADALGAMLISTRWWGMSHQDFGGVASSLTQDPDHVLAFTEEVHQAMANWLVLIAAIRGPLTKAPELHRPGGGDLVYDPSFLGYFGASQGHILGGTLTALADFDRVVLNVGGGAFTHMMPRSGNFGAFALVAGTVYTDPLVLQTYLASLARGFDAIDPAVYAPLVKSKVLLQIGLGDAQVPNVASFLHARALGVKQLLPTPKPIPLLDTTPGGDDTPSLELYDFGVDTSPSVMPYPLAPNQVHEGVRVDAPALRQMDLFLRPGGIIQHTCDGPCDPE